MFFKLSGQPSFDRITRRDFKSFIPFFFVLLIG